MMNRTEQPSFAREGLDLGGFLWVWLTAEGGRSSAGRAPALHAGGREFDPPRLHQLGFGLIS